MATLKNTSKGDDILAQDVLEAKTYFQKVKGLLGKKSLDDRKTLWIPRCQSIHTFFMKFSIDVIFVDKNLKVRRFYKNIPPGRFVFGGLWSRSVFEFKAGSIKSLDIGDKLCVEA